MKKIILIVTLLLSGFIFTTATAQIRVRFNVNIASQPVWGPVGYDHAEYYYLPDIDMFYYVQDINIFIRIGVAGYLPPLYLPGIAIMTSITGTKW
jgi:hypothetical protein